MLEALFPATSVLFQFYPAHVQAIEKAFAEAPTEASRMLADNYSEIGISAVLAALLEMGLEMLEIVAVTAGIGTLVGGAIGFSAGGVGAVPGAAYGLDFGVQVGVLIAGTYGFLVMAKDLLKAIANAATHLGLGVQAAWNAGEWDQHSPIYDININAARTHIASALVILIDELIIAIILVLLHKKPGLEKLRATENGQKLERWAAENQAKLNKWYGDKIKSFERVGDDEAPPDPITETIDKLEGAFGKEINPDKNGVVATRDNAAQNYGVAFFGKDNFRYYNAQNATIRRQGETFFFMPLEDSAAVKNAADAARYTGRAPSAEAAYLDGGDTIGQSGDIFGLSFPADGMKITSPTAIDAGGWPHYLEGGNTAVRTGLDPNAGYLVNPTREFVIPGGSAVPDGSVLFKLGPSGEWIPLRKF